MYSAKNPFKFTHHYSGSIILVSIKKQLLESIFQNVIREAYNGYVSQDFICLNNWRILFLNYLSTPKVQANHWVNTVFLRFLWLIQVVLSLFKIRSSICASQTFTFDVFLFYSESKSIYATDWCCTWQTEGSSLIMILNSLARDVLLVASPFL